VNNLGKNVQEKKIKYLLSLDKIRCALSNFSDISCIKCNFMDDCMIFKYWSKMREIYLTENILNTNQRIKGVRTEIRSTIDGDELIVKYNVEVTMKFPPFKFELVDVTDKTYNK